MPLTEAQKAEPKEFGTVDNFRIRTIPVLGTMPALMGKRTCSSQEVDYSAGQAQAAYILCELGKKPFQPEVSLHT